MRISWIELWKSFVLLVAERSADKKLKVGAVIIDNENTAVLALGYNGDEAGGSNCRESHESGKSGFIHAEINALIKADFSKICGQTLFVTHSPCKMCAKAIINAKIGKVYYINKYDDEGINLLKSHNIEINQI